VFCRNVVIYFNKDTQRRLFARYADVIAPGGYLIIGHSETLYNVCDRFELVGRTVYRRLP
jgi:chemotaxis protein methyltransferase CheR